ncbi:hypothetical protein ACLRGF_12130 [Mycetocola zhadangensis]|uniref:hypothetical protein n=1 Tax=Mycetocola zhadangensis TaxID=1164595 RepID=UPI003A4D48F0
MRRTTLTVDGHSYLLAQGTQLGDLKTTVEDAVRTGGRFVDITVVGKVAVSVLVSPGVPIVLTSRDVADDSRDNGDLSRPFDDGMAWDIAELY